MKFLHTARLNVATMLALVCCLGAIGCNGFSSGSGNGSGNDGSATYSISGTITPATNGSGATVTLSGAAKATTTADATGNYTFSALANGSYTVTPTLKGIAFSPASKAATVNGVNVMGVDFTGAPSQTWSISGVISPAASGNNATVTLSGAGNAVTTADNSGNYTFAAVLNGSYTITPSHTGFAFSPTDQELTVDGANLTDVDFSGTAVQTFSISGSISPAANADGATVNLSGAGSATTTADSSGNYVFNGVPSGAYTVTPVKTGVNFTPYSQDAAVSGSNVASVNFAAASGCSTGHGVANFYVATNGNDSWSGTLDCPNVANTDGPFASLARAQQAVLGINGSHNAPLSVMVREGSYYLPLSATNPGTLNFTASDSGTSTAPITWQNYTDEMPVVSGGIPVSGWTQASGNLWQVSVPANTQPFEYLFYNGERRLRSRLQSASTGTGYYMSGGSCISSQSKQPVSTSLCNLGTFLRVGSVVAPTGANASCPSVTSADGTETKCLDRFQYNPSDPIAQWINLNPPAGNPCGAAGSGSYPAGDVELTLFDAWTVDVMRISCVNTTQHIIYFTDATQGNPNEYDYFGPTAGHRYIVENTRDAFNAAQSDGQTGIWFLDRSTSPWTLNYLANSTENPNTDTVVIPQLGGAIPGDAATDYVGASLLFATNLNYVTFSGITFEADNYIPSAGGVNNDSNEEFAIPQAIDCESCANVTFDGVTVRHTSGSGILIASTSGKAGPAAISDNIQNSAFYDIGSTGIRIGRNPSSGDRASYVPQTLMIQNNIVQGFSRVFPDGEGVAMGNGHDVTIQNNDINDGYHAGVSICTKGCYSNQWLGNGINIITQYNHIWNVMQGITSDGGALYYDIGGSQGSGTGDQILNNLVHDVTDAGIIDAGVVGSGYGGHGIYLDIQSSGVNVENNVLFRIGVSGLTMTQGPAAGKPANTFNNNIVAFARKAMYEDQNPWPNNCTNNLMANITHNIFYFDLDDRSSFYAINGCTDSCGMTYNNYQNFSGNLYWRTDGGFSNYDKAFHVLNSPPPPNQASTCPNVQGQNAFTYFGFSEWQNGAPLVNGQPLQMNEDKGGTVTVNPNFGDSGQASDFLLVQSPMEGFNSSETNNTVNSAGRNDPVIVVPAVPGTYPTYYFTNF